MLCRNVTRHPHMKTETKILIFLFFLSPIIGELLTGSTPPLQFFNPFMFVILSLLYGCGILLIREARVRWNMQWSVIFFAIAYGILEEGTMIQSFFNPGHWHLGNLSGYGMYFGVMWSWALMLILSHAAISILIPLAITNLTWPEYKDKSLINKKGIILSSMGFFGVAGFWIFLIIGRGADEFYRNYVPDNKLVLGSFLLVLLLVWLAYYFRNSRLSSQNNVFSPFTFGVAGFSFMVINTFLQNMLASFEVPGIIAILIHLMFISLVSILAIREIYNRNTSRRHIVLLIFGSLLFWIVLSPIQEFINGVVGITLFGMIGLISLIYWRKKVSDN